MSANNGELGPGVPEVKVPAVGGRFDLNTEQVAQLLPLNQYG